MSSYDLTDLLTLVLDDRAEALSLHVGQRPVVHLGGEPHPIIGPLITPGNAHALLRALATAEQLRQLGERHALEFIYTHREAARFAVHARLERDRLLPELQRE